MEKNSSFLPASWLQAGLAILPGLVAMLLLRLDTGNYWPGLVLASLIVVAVGWMWKRKFPPWTFPAVGVLLLALPGFVLRLFFPTTGGPPPPIFDTLVNLLPIAAWGVIVFIVWKRWGDVSIPKVGWLILIALVAVSLIQDGPLLLFFVLGWMCLPVAVGLVFAWRHQLLAGLLPVAGLFWIVDGIYDPSYFVPLPYSTIIGMALAFAFLVATPLWVLRARSTRAQLFGLLIPPAVTLIACEVLRSFVYPPGYSLKMWFVRGLGMAQILLVLAFASVLYQSFKNDSDSVTHSRHSIVHIPDYQPVPANWPQ